MILFCKSIHRITHFISLHRKDLCFKQIGTMMWIFCLNIESNTIFLFTIEIPELNATRVFHPFTVKLFIVFMRQVIYPLQMFLIRGNEYCLFIKRKRIFLISKTINIVNCLRFNYNYS